MTHRHVLYVHEQRNLLSLMPVNIGFQRKALILQNSLINKVDIKKYWNANLVAFHFMKIL